MGSYTNGAIIFKIRCPLNIHFFLQDLLSLLMESHRDINPIFVIASLVQKFIVVDCIRVDIA